MDKVATVLEQLQVLRGELVQLVAEEAISPAKAEEAADLAAEYIEELEGLREELADALHRASNFLDEIG